MNQQLLDYINQSRQAGKADEQIRQELLRAGWQIVDIDQVLGTKNVNPKKTFLNLRRLFISFSVYILFSGILPGFISILSPQLGYIYYLDKIYVELIAILLAIAYYIKAPRLETGRYKKIINISVAIIWILYLLSFVSVLIFFSKF